MRRGTIFTLAMLASGGLAFLCSCPLGDRALIADNRLPDQVRQISLRVQQQRDGSSEVCRQIRACYGQPALNAGGTEEWKIDGGTLVSHSAAGVFFVTDKSEMVRVCRKQNPLGVCLYGSYSMATNADAGHDRTQYWLGDLEMRLNHTYTFTDSGQFRDKRAAQEHNFFMLHPSGTFEITYLEDFGSNTLLESIHGHARVAKIAFRSLNGASKVYFIARARSSWGKLEFESDEPLEFTMNTRWGQQWH